MEAGPGPGSAASRSDGRSNLHVRSVVILTPWVSHVPKPKTLISPLCRSLLCERGLLQRADGSAKWCQDKTCVLAAIYGPRTTLGRKEDPEQAVVEVVFKPKSGVYRYNAPGVCCALPCCHSSSCANRQHDDLLWAASESTVTTVKGLYCDDNHNCELEACPALAKPLQPCF